MSSTQIAARLKLENYPIQIRAEAFDGNRGAIRRLRHRGKPRRSKGQMTKRGKIPIGKRIQSGVIIRKMLCRKLGKLDCNQVKEAFKVLLYEQPLHSVTLDRGREFRRHGNNSTFRRRPWQRGTNENTNGLRVFS